MCFDELAYIFSKYWVRIVGRAAVDFELFEELFSLWRLL
jgi:hypothetical protein